MEMKKYIFNIIAVMAFALTGCREEVAAPVVADEGIQAGEAVLFTTFVPGDVTTRTAKSDFDERMAAFKAVSDDYDFTVTMYQEGVAEPLGSGNYKPTATVTGEGDEAVTTYAADGTLTAQESSLYWPGNAMRYGFKATAGTTTLQADQTDAAKLLMQDRLLGYGFEPLWSGDAETGNGTDNEDALNYRTAKQWYAANRSIGMVPAGQDASTYYKKIPLYLKHQRSLVTIRLKAGEGVRREDLAFSNAKDNIATTLFSYSGDSQQEIHPLASQSKVNYTSSDFGTPADDVETTEYTAVVEPFDYRPAAVEKVIAEIHLSGQRFTFYASNDTKNSDDTHMLNYDLQAGQHLVITATLGRGSRKILITAYVEEWTETVTNSIVDDYGQAGDPIQINSRLELREFLESDRNKAGNVAIIVPNSLDLEQEAGESSDWIPQPLNCTLNMAGATFFSNHQVFSTISTSGNIINGTISIGNAIVDAAIAETNLGNIERINAVPKISNGTPSTGKATKAGLAVTNSGSILNCSSELPVQGSTGVVGGIAATSVYSSASTMPVIDGCTVNARVDGADGVTGGGIVGQAIGRVTNNAFDYGVTVLQNASNFKNIIHSKANDDTHELRAYGNSWPTKAENPIGEVANPNSVPVAERYTGVIDSQAELADIVNTKNSSTNIFRISNDFSVTGWTYGKKTDIVNSSGEGNVTFKLDGNNHTITTDAMLFSNIMNDIYDLTIRLGGDMIATPEGGEDVIAPLAYSVYAPAEHTVTIRNIQVKGGDHRIQAATAGGIVVWAYGPGNAVIEDCQCKANIQVWVKSIGTDVKKYTGGIAACAARATITRCTFHSTTATLYRNTAETNTGSEDGNDTSASLFFGGILGGTAPKGQSPQENPEVLITDCSSWFDTHGNAQKGAIVGYSQYADGNVSANGILDGCQGNWWSSTSDAVGTSFNDLKDEQVVGKCNSVAPTADTSY